jgi:hypothetical protein
VELSFRKAANVMLTGDDDKWRELTNERPDVTVTAAL